MATTPQRTTATVKSPFLSKTNITAAIMGLAGLLVALGIIPEDLASESTIGGLVAIGSALVIAFRTFTGSVLRRN